MAKASIATISGTFLAPGISLNGRLYTPENIGDAVTRMKAQIADGSAPVVSQYDSHWEDSVLHIVGKITDAQQMPDGSARFTASVPDTQHGHDLAALASTDYLRNVSIYAEWVGDMTEHEIDGEWVVTAPGLNVRRIDYVSDPGVPAAKIDAVVMSESAPDAWRDLQTIEALTVQKPAPFRPAYADPGFREDGKPRLPLATAKQIEDAWNILGDSPVYSPADLARARARVRAAAAAEGMELGEAHRGNRTGMEIVTAVTQPATPPTCTEDLSQLIALDPDQDGDIDAYACPTCGSVRPNTDDATNPDGDGTDLQSRQGAVMTETANATQAIPAAADAAADKPVLSTEAQAIVDAVVEKLTPKTSAPEGETTTTEATAAETTAQTPSEDELIEKITSKLRQEIVDAGLIPSRRGHVRAPEGEAVDRSKLSSNERVEIARRELADWVLPTPA